MTKRNKIILVLGILFAFLLIFNNTTENKVKRYLKKKYKEEFIVEYIGKRNGEIVASVLPIRFLETSKQYDSFYSSSVFVPTVGEIGDNYGKVLLKEDAERYFKPKIEELFGTNVIIAIDPSGYYEKTDFKEEMTERKAIYNTKELGNFDPLQGGIYVFGRVENEEDREHYREQIYQFIQYLKQEGMFDYVDITISVTDERLLGIDFNQSRDKTILDNMEGGNEKYAYINQVMSKYNIDFEKTPQEYKDKILNEKNRNNIFEDLSENAVFLLHSRVRSKKYIKSRKLDEDKEFNSKVKLYEHINEVEFVYEDYKLK